ncbi:terpene synthase [Coniochaeta ligniaria NRRL 30616]|uniref:Bifunctional lycopene cyclase/phytoene synthase n=1 Tax=Coniochaeta ligniaria NRRL 30616 TaxID=1408157 RepID=A0A1J7JM97_9PEZI|nr:terpene synthase [Coniochaeta ligniaria NRRL 30616]
MAFDYAIVHLKFTIPLAALLTLISYPILTRIHLFQIAALVILAFSATLPWDSYLIKTGVWTYPPEVIIGPKWLGIPYEELFFFVIQTYITSLMYILFNKPVLHAKYLRSQCDPEKWIVATKLAGQVFLAAVTLYGAYCVNVGGEYTYIGLILVWAPPFALITWTMAGRFIISLPLACTALPILLPTIYLWLVDELALGRGTWSIESGTKLDLCLFGVLEIEEATFFLVTNTLIVFGLATFDQYLAVIYAFPHLFPEVPQSPTPLMLLQGRFTGTNEYDMKRIEGIQEAVKRLKAKSRSFYLASSAFTGRLRIDLVLLYSFCRMADDLIDNATTEQEIKSWVAKLIQYLDFHYVHDKEAQKPVHRQNVDHARLKKFIEQEFPAPARSALKLLPTHILPGEPLYLLIDGFRMDSQFNVERDDKFPIKDEDDLVAYARRVAGTVGELCVALIVHHCGAHLTSKQIDDLLDSSREMGIALQYVNIARDITTDAKISRVYLPNSWLKEESLTPEMVIEDTFRPEIIRLREKLLSKAFAMYRHSRPIMQSIPQQARGPMIVAVENYMEIGRVLRERDFLEVKDPRRATVPARRRLWVAAKALMSS